MSRNQKITAFIVAIVVIVSVGIYLTIPKGSSNDIISIAGNLPLTGPIAAFSGQYPNGFTMGIDDGANELGIPRDRYVLNFQDNAGKPVQAVSVTQQHMLRKFDVYISGTSDMSTAIAPIIDKANITHFLIAFDAYLSRGSANRMRILPHYKIEGPMYVQYAKIRMAKRVYIIALNLSSIDEEFSKIVEPGFSEAEVEYKREMYDFGTKDYRALALKASEYRPDLIIVSGFSFHIYPILGALRTYGLLKDGSVISTLDLVDLLHGNTPRPELAGVAFIAPLWEVPGSIKGADEWRSRYERRFGKQPSYVEAYAYDTGRIIMAAYKKSGVVNKVSVQSVLPFQGLAGSISLDQDGDLVSTLVIAKVSDNGIVERVDK